MTATLSPADADRLAKLLGLLGSAHAGERDAAGLAAHRLVHSLGVTWFDVICPQPPRENSRRPDAIGWRQLIAQLLDQPDRLRPWEGPFLRSLAGFPRLSPKQRLVLDQIAERVFEREAA